MDTHLKELIDLLERCAGPDRALDALIAKAVGAEHGPFERVHVESRSYDFHEEIANRYTSSIDAAMTLVPEGMEKDFTDLYGVARVSVGINAEPGPFYGTHEGGSLAIALCIAALKAQLSTRNNEQDDARNLSGVSSE